MKKHSGATPRRSVEAEHGSADTVAPHVASAHTPGPWAWEWVAEKSNEWAVGQAWREDGTPISGQIQEGEWLEDTIIERRLIGMNESGHANAADARLIAAAPDLYEALKHAVAIIRTHVDINALGLNHDGQGNWWPLRDEYLHHMDAAIAKAEGRSDD